MHEIRDKKILILSPQEWSGQHISKHHYAKELAQKGNQVLFVCIARPGIGFKTAFYSPVKNLPELMVANYQNPLPFWISFHANTLYRWINLQQIKKLIKKSLQHIDICIDFGHYRMFKDMQTINAKVKIFFPVDDFGVLKVDDRGADLCFSVSKVIVEKMNCAGLKCHFINHGLSDVFVQKATQYALFPNASSAKEMTKIKVGYSGNLMIRFLNRPLFRHVVEHFSHIEFHCFGGFTANNSIAEDVSWQKWLQQQNNVVLHGNLETARLAIQIQNMDLLWLCYAPDNKDYHAENSHKILEYLSTGKVIVSTPISIYKDSGLLEMADETDFTDCFDRTTKNLDHYNGIENQAKRRAFALDNSYKKQIERIESYLQDKF